MPDILFSESISENQFLLTLDEWLDPKIPTAILCRNVVDIMRFRIFFHEKLADRRKSFFNVQFLTPDQFLKKSLPGMRRPENFLRHSLTLKIYLQTFLAEYQNKTKDPVILSLLDLPNFTRQLPVLWHIYLWCKHPGINPGQIFSQGGISLSLLELFSNLDQKLESDAHFVIQDYLRSPAEIWIPDNHQPDQIIYLYPSRFNPVDTIKLHFLISIHPALWRFVFSENQDHAFIKRLPDFVASSSLKNQPGAAPQFEAIRVASRKMPEYPYNEWQSENRFFFKINNSGYFETKIWMSRTAADEAHLLASSVRTLLDMGIAPQNIFILYSSRSDIPVIEYAFRNQGITINHPEKVNSANCSLISLLLDLIDLSGFRKSATKFTRNRMIDFLKNPCLRFPERDSSPDLLEKLSRYFLDNFLQSDIILPHHLQSLVLEHRLAVDGLIRIADLLARVSKQDGGSLFSENLLRFREQIKSYLHPDIAVSAYKSMEQQSSLTALWNDQWSEVEKLLDQFALLEYKLFQLPDSSTLFDFLYEEISNIKINYHKHDSLQKDFPEIYMRSVTEGIHSPVDFLFVCGLTSSNFPVKENYISFLYPDTVKSSLLELAPDDQIQRIRESFALVNSGVALTFNLEKDPAPSDLVFEMIAAMGSNLENKKESLSQIPLYSKQQEISAIAGLNAGSWQKRRDHNEIGPSFNSKINNFVEHNYRIYTGFLNQSGLKPMTSASRVESIAACPQLYWFRHILDLRESINYQVLNKIDRRLKGLLFHEFSGNVMKHLIENYYSLTYAKLTSQIAPEKMNRIFNDCLGVSIEKLLKTNRLDYEKLTAGILDNLGRQFIHYFRKFLYAAEMGTHPFANQYPVAVEKSFENLLFGGIKFTGRIDRLDYSPGSHTLTVIDYKTSLKDDYSCSSEDIRTLSRFQLPLYTLALQNIIPEIEMLGAESIKLLSGAYEMIRTGAKFPEIFFMELDAGKISYTKDEIGEKFSELAGSGLSLVNEIQNEGYFFAVGHKKNMDPENEWEVPCRYCNYSEICDKVPFDTMYRRLGYDKTTRKFLDFFLQNPEFGKLSY